MENDYKTAYDYVTGMLGRSELEMSDDEAMRIIAVLAVYSQFIVTNNPANHKIFVAGIRARLKIGMETENIEKDDLQQAIKRFKNVNSIENYIAEIQSFLKLRNEDLSALPKVAAVQKWVEEIIKKYEIVFNISQEFRDKWQNQKAKFKERKRQKYSNIALSINDANVHGYSIIAKWFSEDNEATMETQISSAQVVERDGDWHLVGIGSPCKKERYLTNAQIIRYADCYPVHVIYDGLNNNVNTGD